MNPPAAEDTTRSCPRCARSATTHVGSLITCPDCGTRFWALPWEDEGRELAGPAPAPPALVVAALHVGVFLAESVLAGAVMGLFLVLPAYGIGRLCGAW